MTVTLRRLGWASMEVATEECRLVLDPFLRDTPQDETPDPDRMEYARSADLLAITHGAHDHLGDAIALLKSGDARMLCSIGVRVHARRQGVENERLLVMSSGMRFEQADILVKAVDARHVSFFKSRDEYLTDQPLSYVVKVRSGKTIFYGGDTSLSGDMKVWGELYRPDIALLNVGGVRVNGRELVELPPDEAALAATWLGVSQVIPLHYYPDSHAPREFADELAKLDSSIEVLELDLDVGRDVGAH